MQRDLSLLKSVLSVPTKTYKEEKMINFLVEWLMANNLPYRVDSQGNIYVTKDDGTPKDKNFYYPCVVAHTDTVHEIDSINIKEEMLKNYQGEKKLSLKAYNDQGKPTGIGGDNKCGVFACLELLKELPNLKASFFVSEETGCHGSKMRMKSSLKMLGTRFNLMPHLTGWLVNIVWVLNYLISQMSSSPNVMTYLLKVLRGDKNTGLIHIPMYMP